VGRFITDNYRGARWEAMRSAVRRWWHRLGCEARAGGRQGRRGGSGGGAVGLRVEEDRRRHGEEEDRGEQQDGTVPSAVRMTLKKNSHR
jgi:hypothetical protein